MGFQNQHLPSTTINPIWEELCKRYPSDSFFNEVALWRKFMTLILLYYEYSRILTYSRINLVLTVTDAIFKLQINDIIFYFQMPHNRRIYVHKADIWMGGTTEQVSGNILIIHTNSGKCKIYICRRSGKLWNRLPER